ncbi:MAG: NUDIX domain-containing protein [Treponema sp.]|nr:NUDIX domain-containing protein [Treponema sp.]
MKNNFNMCPMCGSKKIECRENRKWICPDCGFDLYCNVAAAVGVIFSDNQNYILFEIRAKEPRKGFLALPGGFVDFDESAENAAIRECKEEIGAEISSVDFVCTYPNTYVYKNIEYKTCDMFFSAMLPEAFDSVDAFIGSLSAQKSEVSGFVAKRIETEEDIENLPLAFESAKKTLKTWLLKNQLGKK